MTNKTTGQPITWEELRFIVVSLIGVFLFASGILYWWGIIFPTPTTPAFDYSTLNCVFQNIDFNALTNAQKEAFHVVERDVCKNSHIIFRSDAFRN